VSARKVPVYLTKAQIVILRIGIDAISDDGGFDDPHTRHRRAIADRADAALQNALRALGEKKDGA
jgi:hypothetical protein